MRPDLLQQQRQQKLQRQREQRQQQLLHEQKERMRKQQGSWREQQQKGYLWQQQQSKNNHHYFGAPKNSKNKEKGYGSPLQGIRNLLQTANEIPVKKGGVVEVVSLVVALGFIALAIYGVLWLLSTF